MTGATPVWPLRELPPGIEALCAEAAGEGFRFMRRLVAEWRDGTNRFDRAGEVLLGAFDGGALVGLCGLNRDPYAAEEGIGRLRHLYVLPSLRRRGVASSLVGHLLGQAGRAFHTLRLRTDTPEAAAFYARHGFLPVRSADASHSRALEP
jgi:GNAT superfamily N-acetyltransferase